MLLADICEIEKDDSITCCQNGKQLSVKFCIGELPNDMKMLAFCGGELSNMQKFSLLLQMFPMTMLMTSMGHLGERRRTHGSLGNTQRE